MSRWDAWRLRLTDAALRADRVLGIPCAKAEELGLRNEVLRIGMRTGAVGVVEPIEGWEGYVIVAFTIV